MTVRIRRYRAARMFRLLLVAAIALAACSASDDTATSDAESSTLPAATSGNETGPSEIVQLLYVFDGDSIEVSRGDGTRAEVRLIGINAPEGDECHGDDARNALEMLLEDASLTVVADGEDTDRFGRLLRYVYANNRNINSALVGSGDALALQSGHELEPEFVSAGDRAAHDELGMWSPTACGPQVIAPAVAIADYEFDPAGRDAENANDEWVAFTNESGTADLSGFTLRDESTQHRFVFPDGFTLAQGETVTVHSGCGADSPGDLFWCASDPVWSNGGDTIILQLPGGAVVLRERFAGNY